MALHERVVELYEVLGVPEKLESVRVLQEEYGPSDEGDWFVEQFPIVNMVVYEVIEAADDATTLELWMDSEDSGKTVIGRFAYPWMVQDDWVASEPFGIPEELRRVVLQVAP